MRCMGCMEELDSNRACTRCGYKAEATHDPEYLVPGTVLSGRYQIGALQRKNGESGLYIGFDNHIQRKVWVREYFPSTLASRNRFTGEIQPLEGSGAQYKALMSDFVDVCSAVKELGVSENVIPIENVIRENNTVYAVFRYFPTITLESYLAQQGGRMAPGVALQFLQPLFQTVENVHRAGEIHRGISPYTVFVTETGKLFLGDFMLPATRTGGCELEAELYNGYAAPEQYATNGWQGAWSDVYALAALFYRCVTGSVPPKSTMINANRPLPSLSEMPGNIPEAVSDAVENAMRFDYEERTQSVASFVADLTRQDNPDGNTAVFHTNLLTSNDREDDGDYEYEYEDTPAPHTGSSTFKFLAFALLLTVIVLFGFLYFVAQTMMPGLFTPSSKPASHSGGGSSSMVSSLPEGSEPSVVESEPPESSEAEPKVPRFVGQKLEEIQSREDYKDRFVFEIREQFSNTFEAGQVYDQAPVEGVLMPNRGTVILYVSKGAAKISMPNLTGMDLEEAMKALYELEKEHEISLPIDKYDIFIPDAEPGKIARTEPVAGADFYPDKATIQVYIALEPDVSESVEVSSSEASGGFVVDPSPSSSYPPLRR